MTIDALLADPTIEIVLNLTPPTAHVRGLARGHRGRQARLLGEAARDDPRGRPRDPRCGRVGRRARRWRTRHLPRRRAPDRAGALDEGATGEPSGANAAVLHLGPEQWHPNPGIFFGRGGGPLLDVGPYYVAALVSLLGPIASVSAVSRGVGGIRRIATGPRAGETFAAEVPTYAITTLTFASGVIGGFMASFDVVASRSPHIEIHGADGSLSLGDPNRFDGEVQRWRLAGDAWEDVPLQGDTTVGRGIGLAEMIDAIRTERPHRASAELAFHVLDVLLSMGRPARRRMTAPAARSRSDRPASGRPRSTSASCASRPRGAAASRGAGRCRPPSRGS